MNFDFISSLLSLHSSSLIYLPLSSVLEHFKILAMILVLERLGCPQCSRSWKDHVRLEVGYPPFGALLISTDGLPQLFVWSWL